MIIGYVKEEIGYSNGPHERGSEYETIVIIVGKTNIVIGISGGQSCCEKYGISTGNLKVDTKIKIYFDNYKIYYDGDRHGVKFYHGKKIVDDVYAYNYHEGYYPHNTFVKDIDGKYFYESL